MTELQGMLWLLGGLALSFGPAIGFMIVCEPKGARTGRVATRLQGSGGGQACVGSVIDAGLNSTAGCDMHHSC